MSAGDTQASSRRSVSVDEDLASSPAHQTNAGSSALASVGPDYAAQTVSTNGPGRLSFRQTQRRSAIGRNRHLAKAYERQASMALPFVFLTAAWILMKRMRAGLMSFGSCS